MNIMATKVEATTQGEGLKTYYKGKIEGLEMKIRDKHMDLRRMEAQRNELNAKGRVCSELFFYRRLTYKPSQSLNHLVGVLVIYF